MKFWRVPVILLVLTLTSQAQIPIYGGYSYLQQYYPGAYAPPYYPQAYYLQPYISQSYVPTPFVPTPFVPTPYVPPPAYWPYPMAAVTVPDNTAKVDTLTKQVQDLNDEVKMLQSELTVVQTQAQNAQPQALARVDVPPRELSPSLVLVLKNGQRIEAQGYAFARDTLWIFTPSGTLRMLLSNLNVAATRRETPKRGIDFPDLRN
jgi:hypothetical protein